MGKTVGLSSAGSNCTGRGGISCFASLCGASILNMWWLTKNLELPSFLKD